MAVAVSMLAAGSAWFFARSFVILRSRVASAYQEELGCLYVTFLLIAAGLGQVTVAGISAGRVLASAGVLLFAFAGGSAAGAVLGVGAGLVALALGKDTAFLMGSYAAGGLLAGTANRFGRIPTALCYLAVTALVSVTSPSSRMMQIALAENLLACLIVLVLPGKVVRFVQPPGRMPPGRPLPSGWPCGCRWSGLPRRCGRSATPPGRYPGSWAACTCAVWKMCGSRPWILSAGNVPGGTGAGRVNSTRPWTP